MRKLLRTQHNVTIERMTPKGDGVAIIHRNDTPVELHIRNTLPKDELTVEIRHKVAQHMEALPITWHKRGLELQKPKCKHAFDNNIHDFEKNLACGGCTLQQLNYTQQLELKKQIIEHALADFPTPKPIIQAPNPWFYRNKLELTFAPDFDQHIALGLHPTGYKYQVIPITECHLLNPKTAILASKICTWASQNNIPDFVFKKNKGFLRTLTIRESTRTTQKMLILTTSAEDPVSTPEPKSPQSIINNFLKNLQTFENDLDYHFDSVYWITINTKKGSKTTTTETCLRGKKTITESLHISDEKHLLNFDILPNAFFQPNALQAEKLYDLIVQNAKKINPTQILDLYCGTGTISLACALHGFQTIGIDIEKHAIQNAQQNAQQNNITSSQFFCGDTAEILKQILPQNTIKNPLVIVDPPRRGLLPQAIKQILSINPQHLIYVSCDPYSLARDLTILCENNYQINEIQPIDLLPQTAHIETIVLLSKLDLTKNLNIKFPIA